MRKSTTLYGPSRPTKEPKPTGGPRQSPTPTVQPTQPGSTPTPSPTPTGTVAGSPTPTATAATATATPAPVSQRVAIDPISRIEGHLRIEIQLENGIVTDAWSSSTMFRGFELILNGRDPRQAWVITQRICGVCTTVHSIASVRAVENALGITVPDNARLIRNLLEGIQFVQDHVIHFYHLHALDWVDIVASLRADPAATSSLARSISDWPNSSPEYFAGVKDRIQRFVDSGQLGLFANGYWGHPAYKLPPEANLLAVAHYLEALDWQRLVIQIQTILGGKNPHPQTYLVGGVAVTVDPNGPMGVNPTRIAQIRDRLASAYDFVKRVYMPDLKLVASYYPEWASMGAGVGNFLSLGDFPMDNRDDPANLWLPRGIITGRNLGAVVPVDHNQIKEYVTHSWYTYTDGDGAGRHPYDGQTTPAYTGPNPPYDFLNTDGKYSWLKTPRYQDSPMEVGALARMLVAYAAGNARARELIDGFLADLKLGPEALFSTLGRTAARGIESLMIAETLPGWLSQLEANMNSGNLAIHEGSKWDPSTWPADFSGWGWTEAPRGALGHWVRIQNGAIKNYQAVVPTTWNGSPRDARGQRGPFEQALIGTPVADPNQPIEILRTIHSFDPCMACAVHIIDAEGKETIKVQVVP